MLEFEFGERRRVSLKVWLCSGTTFQIQNCTWTLTKKEQEANGACETEADGNGYILTAEVQPKNQGVYKLQYTFEMGSEIIKKSVNIKVV